MKFDILTRADDATLHWRQPELLKMRYVLVAEGDRTLGHLDFSPPAGKRIIAETAQGQWQFEQVGSWKPQTRAFVGEELVATLEVANVWLGNRAALVSTSGKVIAQWVMTSYLKGSVEWQDDAGALLIAFRGGTDEGGVATWLRDQCRVDFTPAGFAHPHRDLLLTIGWYFTVLASDPLI